MHMIYMRVKDASKSSSLSPFHIRKHTQIFFMYSSYWQVVGEQIVIMMMTDSAVMWDEKILIA